MFGSQWVEYGINSPDGEEHALWVRYTAPADAIVEFTTGDHIVRHAFPATGDGNWRTECLYITPERGESTLRVCLMSGRISLNWLSLR
jgi:hypothetical protein